VPRWSLSRTKCWREGAQDRPHPTCGRRETFPAAEISGLLVTAAERGRYCLSCHRLPRDARLSAMFSRNDVKSRAFKTSSWQVLPPVCCLPPVFNLPTKKSLTFSLKRLMMSKALVLVQSLHISRDLSLPFVVP
jgi:hypothetical protein